MFISVKDILWTNHVDRLTDRQGDSSIPTPRLRLQGSIKILEIILFTYSLRTHSAQRIIGDSEGVFCFTNIHLCPGLPDPLP